MAGSAAPGITFAIIGHNEGQTIANAVAQAGAAAAPGDQVLAVDSASDDDTAARAAKAGAEVLTAPLGKGRAMAAAVAAVRTEWICFLDGDISPDQPNYAAALAGAARRTAADHVLGEFRDSSQAVLSNTVAVYEPLVAGLFPEGARRFGSKPLTGFRAVRTAVLQPAQFPPGFGIEAHLNLAVLTRGGTHEVIPIGFYTGPFRYKPFMGREITAAILDLAQQLGRLAAARRPEWDSWAEEAISVIAGYHGTLAEQPAFRQELSRLAARPHPPAH